MRLPVLIGITVAPVVLNGQRLAHLPPDERIAVRLLYRYPSHSTAQLPQTLGDIVPQLVGPLNRGTFVVVSAARRGV